jgi:hypothetical protein
MLLFVAIVGVLVIAWIVTAIIVAERRRHRPEGRVDRARAWRRSSGPQ